MIAIIDYGMGNLRSVQKALEKVGADAVITQDPKIIANAAKVVLPGVGAMAPAMTKLGDLGLIGPIQAAIKTGKPFLGICLGLQLLFEKSHEGGEVEGLRILEGSVEKFRQLKVPHMGWNQLTIQQPQSKMFRGIATGADVYFCHSYHVRPRNPKVIATTTQYGVDFVSAVCRDNLWGVQFHPEKSQTIGLQLLKNFAEV